MAYVISHHNILDFIDEINSLFSNQISISQFNIIPDHSNSTMPFKKLYYL